MNWKNVLRLEMVTPHSTCQMIIVGETAENLPFCYEDQFTVQKTSSEQVTVILPFVTINPIEKLDKVSFIELSYRDKGILYYAFVNLLNFEVAKNKCILTLSAPDDLFTYEPRRFNRVNLPTYTPITCSIVGVRAKKTHQGIPFKGELLEISGGGLSFVTSTRLFYPIFLQLNFSLPNFQKPFQIHGEIMRASHFSNDSYRIAVEFRDVSENTLDEIDHYCSNA